MDSDEVYIGTKIILARPMNEDDFAKEQGKTWEPERPARKGYRVRYADGYVSWSPTEPFEQAYRIVTSEERNMIL